MTFGRDIRRYAELQKQRIEDVIVETLVNLTATVVIKTPVDTGQARANWQPTTDVPANGTIRNVRMGGIDLNVAEDVARDSVNGVYFLVNNLPYIRRLEYEGWSEQAPRGMVRVSIEEFQQFLNDAIANN